MAWQGFHALCNSRDALQVPCADLYRDNSLAGRHLFIGRYFRQPIGTAPALLARKRIVLIPRIREKELAMLVLSRKLQEQIKIGEEITVTVLKVKATSSASESKPPKPCELFAPSFPS